MPKSLDLKRGFYRSAILGKKNSVDVDDNGVINNYPLKVPSGEKSGLKLVNDFNVSANKFIQVYLDFNIDDLKWRKGHCGYKLKPVIEIAYIEEYDGINDIGPDGGNVTTIDNSVSIDFPAGTFVDNQVIYIENMGETETPVNSPTSFIGNTYTIISNTPTYQEKVTVTMTYTDAQITASGLDESKLDIFYFNTEYQEWIPLVGQVDTTNNTVTGLIKQSSDISLGVYTKGVYNLITKEDGGEVKIEGEITLQFPPDAIQEEAIVYINYVNKNVEGAWPINRIDEIYSMKTNIPNFNKNITITFKYSEEDITKKNIDESSIRINFFSNDLNSWISIPSTVNRETNIVSTNVSHFTYFAISGRENISLENVSDFSFISNYVIQPYDNPGEDKTSLPTYTYAPSFMYDETEGIFKLWVCSGLAGDHIVYYKANTLLGLKDSKPVVAYSYNNCERGLPTCTLQSVDYQMTCDPNVIRAQDGKYYLYYGGNNQRPDTTRIGVAVSTNGGETFQRINPNSTNPPIMTPLANEGENPFNFYNDGAGYGIGQPSVVYDPDDPEGYYYMIYSDFVDGFGDDSHISVAKSKDPSFSPENTIPVKRLYNIGGASIDAAFDKDTKEFYIIINDGGHEQIGIQVIRFDKNFIELGRKRFERKNADTTFGEGVGILTDSRKRIFRMNNNGYPVYTFVGATHCFSNFETFDEEDVNPINRHDICPYNIVWKENCEGNNSCNRNDHMPFWVRGPIGLAQFTVNNAWSGAWDIGFYNPNGLGNFYIRYGNELGSFDFETAWPWGIFPNEHVFTGDFDGDGYWDVGLYNPNNLGNFYIQYGNGSGLFERQTVWHWGVFPEAQVITGEFR